MLMIETSKKFDKDLKILVKNGFDLKLLYKVVENLAKEQPLDPKYKDHPLKGALKPFRECHLKPNLLLVYQIKKQENTLFLVRLGSHSELFCKSPAQLITLKLTAHQLPPLLGIKFRVKTPLTLFGFFKCPRVSRFLNTLVCAFPYASKPLHNGGFQPLF
ncbi:hypothetical protein HpBT069_14720 [Helicobacter pylori]